jgi:hypothetical protein
MKWFARDDRHSLEVFRVFGVKFQLSPKPARLQPCKSVMSQSKSTLPFSRIFSSSGGATETDVLFCELPCNAEGDKPSGTFR